MDTLDLIKRVRQIEIKTRGLTQNIFAGQYHTAFKGRGMMFSEVREYQFGDDIRNIDWNVTARHNHTYVKVFEEERELTVMLMIDVSGSRNFGSSFKTKKNIISEIAAILSFSAIQNNDKIGVIFFSYKIEKFIPPQKGKTHILHIIRELVGLEPKNKKTDISQALRYMTNVIKKRSTVFVISDFMDNDYEKSLTIANRKHDVVTLHIYDKREKELPNVGLIKMVDAETNSEMWVDTSDAQVRNDYARLWNENVDAMRKIFSKSGVDSISISTDEDYVKPLIDLFARRS